MSTAIIPSAKTVSYVCIPRTGGWIKKLRLSISRLWRDNNLHHLQKNLRIDSSQHDYHPIFTLDYVTEKVVCVANGALISEITEKMNEHFQINLLEDVANRLAETRLSKNSFCMNLRKSQHGKFLNTLTDLTLENLYDLATASAGEEYVNISPVIHRYVILGIVENFIGYKITNKGLGDSFFEKINQLNELYRKSFNQESYKKESKRIAQEIFNAALYGENLFTELKHFPKLAFSDDEIIEFIQTLFGISTEMIASWLISALGCFAESDEIAKNKLISEAQKNCLPIITQNMQRFKYLEAFLKEVWRLHTPIEKQEILVEKTLEIADVSHHQINQKGEVTNAIIPQYRIPANTKVCLIYSLSHREEKSWHQPEVFDLDRFYNRPDLKRKLHYFAAGANGTNFAELIVKVYMIEFLKSIENIGYQKTSHKEGEFSSSEPQLLKINLKHRRNVYE